MRHPNVAWFGNVVGLNSIKESVVGLGRIVAMENFVAVVDSEVFLVRCLSVVGDWSNDVDYLVEVTECH